MSACSMNMPIEPTAPPGVMLTLVACDASQYAAEAAWLLTEARMGFRALASRMARATSVRRRLPARGFAASGEEALLTRDVVADLLARRPIKDSRYGDVVRVGRGRPCVSAIARGEEHVEVDLLR